MLESTTRSVTRGRTLVVLLWVLFSAVGLFGGFRLDGHLTAIAAVPGSPSDEVQRIIGERFGSNSDGSYVVILHFKQADDAQIATFQKRIAEAVLTIPTARVEQSRAVGGVLFAWVGSSMTLAEASDQTPQLRAALKAVGLDEAMVSGPPALEHDVRPLLAEDLKRGGAIALVLALTILIALLGWSRAVAIPLIVAGATVSVTLGLLYLLAQVVTMVLYVPNIVELIGLGLAIDYSLLMVHRFRSEVEQDPENAVWRTVNTAGRTVLYSGITVALGLATLLLVPIPFVRSLGLATVVVTLVSVLAALTLQPAMLSFLGPRGVQARGFRGLLGKGDGDIGVWSRIAERVIARPVLVLVASLVVLTVAAAPILSLKLAPASLTTLPRSVESASTIEFLTARGGPGLITPHEVLIDFGSPSSAQRSEAQAAQQRLANHLSGFEGVSAVGSDTTDFFIDPSAQFQRFIVISQFDFGDPRTQEQVDRLRSVNLQAFGYNAQARILVGGAPAQGADFINRITSTMPAILILLMVFAFVVMVRAFGSILLPIKALLLNLMSVAATLGMVTAIFQWGLGERVGLFKVERLESWALVFLVAALFGLSMDYHIFIVSRMREAWLATGSNIEAIRRGISSTGGVITAAAATFVGALSGLAFGQIAGLQELGIGLALGVVIDATIIRALLLPSAMVLIGKRNWWMPRKKGSTPSGEALPSPSELTSLP
jgi:putative drug exporter of the RND superfamily